MHYLGVFLKNVAFSENFLINILCICDFPLYLAQNHLL